MQKTKKILAVLLAALMACTCFSVSVFAANDADSIENTYAAKLADWRSDYAVIISELTNNSNWANWQYVAENDSKLSKTMLASTILHLNDNAWQNAANKSFDKAKAKDVLAGLLEQYEADFGSETVEKILGALGKAKDIADLVTKVNSFVKGNNFLNSDEWAGALGTFGNILKYANYAADKLAEAEALYARILTVKMAGEKYATMLQYIADNCANAVCRDAASELLDDIAADDAAIVGEILATLGDEAGYDAAILGLEVLMDTNVYTGTAKTIYNTLKGAANKVLGTGELYGAASTLLSTFYFETTVNDWTKELLAFSGDAELTMFALEMNLSMRESGNKALVNWNNANNSGWINKLIGKALHAQYVAELAKIAMIKDLFNAEDTYTVSAIISVFCPVAVTVNEATIPNAEYDSGITPSGYFKSAYSDANAEYIKTAIPFGLVAGADDLVLAGVGDGDVQVVIHTAKGEFAFKNNVGIANGETITIKNIISFAGELPEASFNNGAAIEMAKEYKAQSGKTTTTTTSSGTTTSTTTTSQSIGNIFSSLFASLKEMFSNFFANLFAAFSFKK